MPVDGLGVEMDGAGVATGCGRPKESFTEGLRITSERDGSGVA